MSLIPKVILVVGVFIDWTSIYGNTRKECVGPHCGWLVDSCISSGVKVECQTVRNIFFITYHTLYFYSYFTN